MIWLAGAALAAETVLLARGSTWQYLDTGVDPGPSWTLRSFDDAAWASGAAPLGYGIAGVATTVSYGVDPLNRYPTTWLRAEFQVVDPLAFEAISLHLRRDDGAAVWINGVEVHRSNLAPNATAASYAIAGIYGLDQDVFEPVVVPVPALRAGTNVVAVELHNQSATSADLVVDVGISGWDGPTAVTRGPWIQQGGPDGALIRWNTDGPSSGTVWWGSQPQNLPNVVTDPQIRFAHEARITGAAADSLVAYAVGHATAGTLAGADVDHVLRTSPAPGTRVPFRAWVLGDSGTANPDAEAVREAWRVLHPDPLDTDLVLMLGDNAYGSGKDSEYQRAVFDFYPEWLRQVSVWATIGNHDGYSAYSDTQTGPYFDVFTFPTAGEVGGVPSGTEAYWSFDYANVHFVNLDSYHSDRSSTGAMAQWLEADLASTTQDWTVAFFHHPPYSRGSHDSDRELELVEMREFLLPILEEYGVDLALAGHSHSYERSYLLDSHYGETTSLTQAMIKQGWTGDPDVDAPYTKWPEGAAPHQGAVYVVAGSSGQVSGGSFDHPAMLVNLAELGSMGLEFDGLTLRAEFIDDQGAVLDAFEIHKGVTTITSLGGSSLGLTNEELAFTVEAVEPDGEFITDFDWDWGDGTPDGSGAAPTHTWTTEGEFDVIVTATDDAGAETVGTWRVSIDDGIPEISSATWSGVSLEGAVLTFSATAADPTGDPLTYTWTFDGQTKYGSTVTHSYWQDGTYVARLVVSDDAGRTDAVDLPVSLANAAPELIQINGTAVQGVDSVLFAVTDDPGLDIVSVEWRLPDGPRVASSVVVNFPDAGPVTFDLVLRDGDGAEVTETVTIDVQNAPPTVDASGPAAVVEGEVATFTAAASDAGGGPVTVRWAFGDGQTAQGLTATHSFRDDGVYSVVATAEDGEGAVSSAPFDVTVSNVDPQIDGVTAPATAREGEPTPFRADVSDAGVDDVLVVRWDVGGVRAIGAEVSLALAPEGRADGTVTVSDDDGGSSAIFAFAVDVGNGPPRFTSEPPKRVGPGGDLVYTVVAEDSDPFTLTLADGPPGADLDGDVIRWSAPSEVGASAAFRVVATDDEGAAAEQSFVVVVNGAAGSPDGPTDPKGCGCASTSSGAWWAWAVAACLRRRRV